MVRPLIELTVVATLLLSGSRQEAAAQCVLTTDAGADTFLCHGNMPVQLQGNINGTYLEFSWSPSADIAGGTALSPIVVPSATTQYVLSARGYNLDNNLIVNGDFEDGNIGFTSQYLESPGNLLPEGVFQVLNNPRNSHPNFAKCGDHTTGNGKMMAVNGAGTPGLNVWCQTVTVDSNTAFVFSAWVATLVSASPAILQFSINGNTIGPLFTAPSATCNWSNFFTVWNSGAESSADICIVNQNLTLGGNDFALDDLVFSPICNSTDTSYIHIIDIEAIAHNEILPCEGSPLPLSGEGSTVGPNVTYHWETVNGNILSGENTLNPLVDAPGDYSLTVSFVLPGIFCSRDTLVEVVVSDQPFSAWIIPPDPIGCEPETTLVSAQSSMDSVSQFSWATEDGNIIVGNNTSAILVGGPGTYSLLVTNLTTGCTAYAEALVTRDTTPPIAEAEAPQRLSCRDTIVTLSGLGSSLGSVYNYSWSTMNGRLVAGHDSLSAWADATGTYVLTVFDTRNHCKATDTIELLGNFIPPTISIGKPEPLTCQRDSTSLSASIFPTGSFFIWSSEPGTWRFDTNALNPVVFTGGRYFLYAVNPENGCTGIDSIFVAVDTLSPSASIQPTGILTCANGVVTISSLGSSFGSDYTYLWSTPDGSIIGPDTSQTILVSEQAIYQIMVTNIHNGCTAQASTIVTEDRQPPLLSMGPDQLIYCHEPVVEIAASALPSGSLFQWFTADGNLVSGTSSPAARADAAGTYTVLVTRTDNGCSTSGSLFVESIPPPLFQPLVMQPNCLTPTGSIAFDSISGGLRPFQYAIQGGQSSQTSPFLDNLVPGIYALVLTDDLGCSTSRQVQIQPPIMPAITIDDYLSISLGTSAILVPQTNMGPPATLQWQWSPTEGLSCANCPSPLASPTRTTQYFVTVTDSDGCSDSTSILILVNRARNLYAPNVFSPGSSGLNDRFVVYGEAVEVIESLQVFDRWGNLLFQARDIPIGEEAQGWNGTHRGQPLNPGVYVWMAKIRFIDGESDVFSGDITLLR